MIINEKISTIKVLPKTSEDSKHSFAIITTQSGKSFGISVGMLKEAPIPYLPDHVEKADYARGVYNLIVNADVNWHQAGDTYQNKDGNPTPYKKSGYDVNRIEIIDTKLESMLRDQRNRDKYGISSDVFAFNSGATMSFNLGGVPVNNQPKTEPKTEPQVGDGGDTGNGEK